MLEAGKQADMDSYVYEDVKYGEILIETHDCCILMSCTLHTIGLKSLPGLGAPDLQVAVPLPYGVYTWRERLYGLV